MAHATTAHRTFLRCTRTEDGGVQFPPELLAAGGEVGYSKEVRTGFKVGAKDGGYYISFSDQDFDALLKEYLRDKVYKMLYNA